MATKKKLAKSQENDIGILIVDDDYDCGLLEDNLTLRWSNLKVRRETSNERAFEALRSARYDLIFYDLGMASASLTVPDYSNVFKIRELSESAVLIGMSAELSRYHQKIVCLNELYQNDILFMLPDTSCFENLIKKYGFNLIEKVRRKR